MDPRARRTRLRDTIRERKENTAADFLSRIDCEIDNQVNKESEFIDRFIYNMSPSGNFLDEILEVQTNDPAISFVSKQLNERGNVLSDVTKTSASHCPMDS